MQLLGCTDSCNTKGEAAEAEGTQVQFNSDGYMPAWFVNMVNRTFPSTGSEKVTDLDFRKWSTGTMLPNPEVQNNPRVTREHSTTMRVPERNHRFPLSSYRSHTHFVVWKINIITWSADVITSCSALSNIESFNSICFFHLLKIYNPAQHEIPPNILFLIFQ